LASEPTTKHTQDDHTKPTTNRGTVKLLKSIGIAVTALLMLTAALAATAMATTVPNILPQGTAAEPVTATTSTGETEFGNGFIKIISKSSTGTESGNATKSGAFTNKYKGVKDTLGSGCKGTKDTEAETVTLSGTFHVRAYKEGTSLRAATIFSLNEYTFDCGSIETKMTGCVAGALLPENTKTRTLTITLARNGSVNDNKIVTVLNEGNTENEKCQLLAKMGSGGAFELSSLVATLSVTEFKRNGAATEVEVMPL
jgi:hypothetical protein